MISALTIAPSIVAMVVVQGMQKIKHRGDTTPEPSGGLAAERLRVFEEAGGLVPGEQAEKKLGLLPRTIPKMASREKFNARQDRRKA